MYMTTTIHPCPSKLKYLLTTLACVFTLQGVLTDTARARDDDGEGRDRSQRLARPHRPARAMDPDWSFNKGAEFPGADGKLEKAGHDKKTAVLHYRLGCNAKVATLPDGGGDRCGRYVAMSYKPEPPIEVQPEDEPTIEMDLLNPQGVLHPGLRVKDATGQILQFQLRARTLENVDGKAWQHVQQYVGRSKQSFGGAADGVLHPPIKEIAVLAGDTGMLFPPGELQVNNIRYLPQDDAVVDLSAVQFGTGGKVFPTYVGHLAVAAHSPSNEALDKAKAVGIRIIRTDMFWDKVERNGEFNFERYDRLADALKKRGMSALWILDYGHPDHGGGPPLSEEDRKAYIAFATQAAKRYKGDATFGFEIWNEPHLAHYWKNPDPVAYGRLLLEAGRAIKAVNPQALVVSSGVGTPDVPFLVKMMSVSKSWPIDAISLHPYRKDAPENHAAFVEPMRQTLAAAGVTLPIWDTEWGYSAAVDIDRNRYGGGHDGRALKRHAQLQLRKILTQMALGTPVHTLYSLNNSGVDPFNREHNFGLLTKEDDDKPAMEALRTLHAAQSGRSFQGLAGNVPPGLHVARWAGKGDAVLAVWSDAGGRDFQLKLPKQGVTVRDMFGQVLKKGEGDAISLTEEDGVLFVSLPM